MKDGCWLVIVKQLQIDVVSSQRSKFVSNGRCLRSRFLQAEEKSSYFFHRNPKVFVLSARGDQQDHFLVELMLVVSVSLQPFPCVMKYCEFIYSLLRNDVIVPVTLELSHLKIIEEVTRAAATVLLTYLIRVHKVNSVSIFQIQTLIH